MLLWQDGTVLDESLDIMRRAWTQHGLEGWLVRDEAALIVASDGAFKQGFDRDKYFERYERNAFAAWCGEAGIFAKSR